MKKRLLGILLAVCMVISLLPAVSLPVSAATGDLPTTMWIAPSETNNIPSQINLYKATSSSGGWGSTTTTTSYQLFLPGNVDPANCFFSWADGLQGNDGSANYSSGSMPVPAPGKSKTYTFTKGSSNAKFTVTTYQGSPSVKPIFIEIDESQGTIAAMNNDRNHNTACTGEIVIDGERYGLPQMKGRGNYTWFEAKLKKPYNITLDQKVNILGIDSGATKKWSLLNNIADHSLLRNKTAYDMAYQMGIGLDSAYADVWMNGEYQGAYLVTPKYDSFITSDGYLLEHDNKVEPSVEQGGDPTFTLPSLNDRITIKKIGSNLFPGGVESVETIKAAASQIEGWTKEAWEAINSSTGYNSKGKYYTEYVDLPTWAAMYLMQDYVKDYDVNAGSKLFRRDGTSDSDKLIGGPLWDCDNALGRTQSNPALGSNAKETDGYGFYVKEVSGTSLWKSLGKHEDFMEEVYKVYNRNHAVFDNVVQSIEANAKEIEASAEMNFIKDPHNKETYNNSNMNAQTKQSGTKYEQKYVTTNTWTDYVSNLKTFTAARSLFFNDNYTREIEDEGNRAIFKCGSHSSVTTYDTQDTTGEGHPNAKEAFARNSETGEISFDGEGQINFRVNLTDNYQLVGVSVVPTANYKNLKEIEPGVYRITKVTGPIDITIETAETICEHEFVDGVCTKCGKELFQVTVEHDEHCTVTAYPTQDLTTGGILNPASVYPRSSATGEIDASGEGQASFVVAVEDGYEIASVTAAPANYKNLKLPEETGTEGYYRITKISGPVTFKVTTRKRVGPYDSYFANGSISTDWSVLNEDTSAYSLVKGAGLVLPTQKVDVKGNTTGWKNCFVTGIMDGDFKVVTKVHFPVAPNANTQQAKMMLWQDENNYIAIGCQTANLTVEAGRETNGTYSSVSTSSGGWGGSSTTRKLTAASDKTVTAYFAIERVGTTINLSYSQDGLNYTQFNGIRNVSYTEPKIALFATQGSSVTPINANFEYFVVRERANMTRITNEATLIWAAQNVADYVAADLPKETSSNLVLDAVPHGYTVSLNSDNTAVISSNGKVTQPLYDTDVAVTVNVTEGTRKVSSQPVTIHVAGTAVCSHTYKAVVTAPTCTAGGYTTYTCTRCGDTYTADETQPIDHNFVGGKCTVCGLLPYVITFNCDNHCSVIVYESQAEDSPFVENAKTAYARNSDTGVVDISGEGQVNFTVVPAPGYAVESVTAEPKNYKNLKTPADTFIKDGYRITKVTGDFTVTVTTVESGICDHTYSAVVTAPTCASSGYTTYTCTKCGDTYVADETEPVAHNFVNGKCTFCGQTPYVVTFDCDSHCSVIVYESQAEDSPYEENAATAYARNGDTGLIDISGDGQVNFTVVPAPGYEIAAITAAPQNYKNLKTPADTLIENGYRITKVTGNFTVTVTTVEVGACDHTYTAVVTAPTCAAGGYTTYTCTKCGDTYVADETLPTAHNFVNDRCTVCGLTPYIVSFNCDSHCFVIAYESQAEDSPYTEKATKAYARNGDTGVVDISGDGQVNFTVVAADGYEIESVTAAPKNYKNLKLPAETLIENGYRITKVTGNFTVTVTTVKAACDHTYAPVVTAPTCTSAGYTTYICSQCGDSYTADEVAALGHDWDKGTVTRKPTYTAEGEKTYTCSRCGKTYTEAIPKLEFSMQDIDFKDANSADRFEIINQNVSAIRPGQGLYMITTKDAFEPANNQLSGTAATTPKDLVLIPVEGDWTATLKFNFNTNNVSNGYYQFFGFYAMTDYNNCVGIRGGDGAMQDFLRKNGNVTAETKTSSPGLKTNGDYWFRIVKEGTTYTCYRSSDGINFTEMFSFENTGIEADQIAIDAYTGMTTGYVFLLDTLSFNDEEPHEHNYVAVVTEPTCTTGGYTTYTCECGDTYTANRTAALGHDLHETRVEATCTNTGSVTTTCSRCDYRTTTSIAALGHNYSAIDTAPTCTEGGYTTYTCTRCGNSYKANQTSALGHDLIETRVEATCTKAGSVTSSCSRCDYTSSTKIAAKGHSYTSVVIEPTCTKSGYTLYTCSRCGSSFKSYPTTALGHDLIETRVEPTCTTAGSVAKKCSRCSYQETATTIAALGHSYTSAVTAATCTEGGYTTYTCSRCGDSYQANKTAALGHDLKQTRVEATCTKAGSVTEACSRCDYQKVTTIAALGHNYTSVVTAATCTEGGYTTYTCSRCGDSYQANKTAALGHNLKQTRVEATCTKAGSVTETCSRCDYQKVTTIAALGHSYTSVVTAATCTEGGYTTYTCSRCGDSYQANKTAALGHNLKQTRVEATCTKAGSVTEACSRCDYQKVTTIAALGHNYTSVVTAATCTTGGYTTYTCSRCGNSYQANKTAALGHNLKQTRVEATCTTAGSVTNSCTRCDYKEVTEIPALGHDFRNGICSRCGMEDPDADHGCDGGANCPGKAFKDLPAPGTWQHEAIDYCMVHNIMNGMSTTMFEPDGTLTRGQLVTVLYRVSGRPAVTFEKIFPDVTADKYYAEPVIWAAKNGIVNGFEDGTFRPESPVTREQVATILYRYDGSPAVSGSLSAYPDASTVQSYATTPMIWATQNNFLPGITEEIAERLAPRTDAARVQIASFIMRYMESK